MEALDQTLATPSNSHVDVIIAHGMCTHDESWVATSTTKLINTLGLNETITAKQLPTPSHFGNTELFTQAFSIRGKQLRLHTILWSSETTLYKQQLCYDRDDKRSTQNAASAYCIGKPENKYMRANINDGFKNSIMNECLSDVLAYAGVAREAIQNDIEDAIIVATGSDGKSVGFGAVKEQAENSKSPLFFITESLGSKIIFDTLWRMSLKEASQKVAKNTFSRTVQIFMGANQIPILSLMAPIPPAESMNILGGKKASADPLANLFNAFGAEQHLQTNNEFHRANQQPGGHTVVAFSDPNDLLSYPLHDSEQEKNAAYHIKDVIVSNDYTWIWLLENPSAAHLRYLENKEVNKIIACGIPKYINCKIP